MYLPPHGLASGGIFLAHDSKLGFTFALNPHIKPSKKKLFKAKFMIKIETWNLCWILLDVRIGATRSPKAYGQVGFNFGA